jgi:hypothetical protein
MTAAYGAVIRVAGACVYQTYSHACLIFTRACFMRAIFHARHFSRTPFFHARLCAFAET